MYSEMDLQWHWMVRGKHLVDAKVGDFRAMCTMEKIS
jgi:hypothetical protein